MLRDKDHRLLAALKKAGVVDTLASALDHESPYCVAAAASDLLVIGQANAGGLALLQSGNTIPALVRVIERARPLAPVRDTGLYERCVPVSSPPVWLCSC